MMFARILLYLSFAATLLFILSGYGYQWNIWSLGTAFTILRYSTFAAMGAAVISLGALWFLRKSGVKVLSYIVIALIFTAAISFTSLYWMQRGQSVPPIHDITTDLENPPGFVAMVRLRSDAPNPPGYAGEETAEAQREAYPHIQPLVLDADLQEVMDEAVILITARRWDLVSLNRRDGRIEATETLAWFGFKDDVVLRFGETEEGTRVDMRSKSRVGMSDLGVNAKRIENFLEDLKNTE